LKYDSALCYLRAYQYSATEQLFSAAISLICWLILGPLLFLIYVNDIQEICHLGSDLYLYADDSKLFRYLSEEIDSIALQLDLNSLKDCF